MARVRADFRTTHPDDYAAVQALFNAGTPPVVEVSDHGWWEDELANVRPDDLVSGADWGTPEGQPSFGGLPGFRYSGQTLDRVVFPRSGVLREDLDSRVVALGRRSGVEDLVACRL